MLSSAAGRALALSVFVGAFALSTAVSTRSADARRSCSQSDAVTYIVVAGDSWFSIANGAGIKRGPLFKANGATESSPIHPEDELCLPTGTSAPISASADAAGPCSSSDATAYTVGAGDSWFTIAHAAGVKLGTLFKANDATDSSPIHPGQVLCVPPTASPSTASTVTRPRGAGGLQALPVQGPCQFVDTWQASRGGGRRHEGVDLIAKAGQYVYAVVDGTLTKRAWAQPGLRAGNAWYLTSADGSDTYYFYAHLSGFASGLNPGSKVRAGQIIGFVGKTGNTTQPHLHFEIHPNGGNAINPYPTIKAMGGCNSGDPYQQPGGWTPNTSGG